MLRGIRWLSYGLIAFVLLSGGVFLVLRPQPGQSRAGAAVPGGVSVGGPFSLTDEHGAHVTDASYRGRWMLVYFGYTFCPDVCPTDLQHIATALDRLGPQAASVAPLFITIDPARDTPATLAAYTALFDPRIIGLTGTAAQIAAAAGAYRVYYAKVTPKGSATYAMDHSAFIYLMGPHGKFRALFPQDTTPQQLADAIHAQMGTS